MARPRKDQLDARGHPVSVRLTPDERVQLQGKADVAGLSLSDFIRQAALGASIHVAAPIPTSTASPAGVAHIVALNRVGVNLNQIARALNAETGFNPAELDDALKRVCDLLDEWQGISA